MTLAHPFLDGEPKGLLMGGEWWTRCPEPRSPA